MNAQTRLRGLYAITDGSRGEALTTGVAQALAGGARVVQYRDKSADAGRRREEAITLLTLCRARGVPLIINDDVALAAAIGADGVHLGRDDGALAEARAALGPTAIIGVSCYADLERAARFAAEGADYLAFGAFFPSPTKPDAARAAPELIGAAKRRWEIPVVAIGGITPENGGQLVAAGADMVCAISGVFAARDVTAAARAYAALFT